MELGLKETQSVNVSVWATTRGCAGSRTVAVGDCRVLNRDPRAAVDVPAISVFLEVAVVAS